jgi:tryptophan-rich sensory protein
MLGIAFALVLDARGARGRGIAIALFIVQLLLNLAWSPTFFAAHEVTIALWIIIALMAAAGATALAFSRIRPAAAWLMLPYLAWLCFAAVLNYEMDRLNPDAETMMPAIPGTVVDL